MVSFPDFYKTHYQIFEKIDSLLILILMKRKVSYSNDVQNADQPWKFLQCNKEIITNNDAEITLFLILDL